MDKHEPRVGFGVVASLVAALAASPAVAQDVASPQAVRGLVRAVHEATLATEISARIVRIPFRDGDAFRRGDVLVEFDCERPAGEWRAAEAERAGAQAALENSRRLAEYKAAGVHDVLMARAAFDKATAGAEVLAARLKQCKVVAPFDGKVADLPVREHELPQAGQPLMRIVSQARLELDMIVPAKWLNWLKPGNPLVFLPDDNATRLEGRVIRISGAVEPVSQTIRIVGEMKLQPGDVLPGQAGQVRLARPGT